MSKPMSPIDPHHDRVVAGGIPFAIWLREQLTRLGLEPTEAARRFSVSVEVTRGYMRGFVMPTPVTLARIESAVGAKYSPPADPEVVLSISAHATVQAGGGDDIVVTLRLSRAKLLSLLAA